MAPNISWIVPVRPIEKTGTERSGTSDLAIILDKAQGKNMPGIDFDRLRREISMEQVLDLLGFEPTQPLELWVAFTQTLMHPAMIELCHALGREVPWIRRW